MVMVPIQPSQGAMDNDDVVIILIFVHLPSSTIARRRTKRLRKRQCKDDGGDHGAKMTKGYGCIKECFIGVARVIIACSSLKDFSFIRVH